MYICFPQSSKNEPSRLKILFGRCTTCWTKNYCSEECSVQDQKEKHKKFCKEDADERKVKCGAKERKENKMYNMSVFEASLASTSAGNGEDGENLTWLTEACRTWGSRRKEEESVETDGKGRQKDRAGEGEGGQEENDKDVQEGEEERAGPNIPDNHFPLPVGGAGAQKEKGHEFLDKLPDQVN